jgi:hypothetical protein
VRRGALALGAALLVAGCGGGMPAQDEDEPEGEFPLAVTEASFPENQSLAQDSSLVIDVRNVGNETVPNINVTVTGFDRKLKDPLNPAENDPSVADPSRPVFVVDKSPVEFLRDPPEGEQSLVDREVNPPEGHERRGTSYVNTYSLGELAPDDNARFRWDLSAVEEGEFKVRYEVNAGLDGNAVAVSDGGEPLSHTFTGVIESTPPPASIASDGKTIVKEQAKPIGGGGGGVILGD